MKILTVLLVVILCTVSLNATAEQKTPIAPDSLDQSIEEVLSQREFSWRMPREKVQQDEDKPKGPVATLIEWISEKLSKAIRALEDLVGRFFEWLEGLLPKRTSKPTDSDTNWIGSVRVLIGILLALLLCFLAFIFWRTWKRKQGQSQENKVSAVALPTPDLTDEAVTADELPADRWLTLANEFAEKGDLLLAMRALYLATLARLATQELITIEIYKSNREYERELNRRAHSMKDLLADFAEILNVFESAWYGLHGISRTVFEQFTVVQKRIMAIADK